MEQNQRSQVGGQKSDAMSTNGGLGSLRLHSPSLLSIAQPGLSIVVLAFNRENVE